MSVVVLTGANSGIGLALAKQLSGRGDDVIACVRSSSPELVATGAEIHQGIDLRDAAAIDAFCREMAKRSIDVLINNAGTSDYRGQIENMEIDTVRNELEINVLGPLRLTKGLVPAMSEGGKIVFISSAFASIEENESGSCLGYRMSKSSVNMITKTLCNELWARFISTVAIHPGFVKTRMTDFAGHWEPEDAARGVVARIDKLSMDTSGTFWHQDGRQIPW